MADAWRRRGHHADPEAVLVTTSGQQAIDLAVRALVEPGDVVLCETPTYAGAVDALVASRARIVPIPVDANGLRVDAVADAIRVERPRLLFANPTGNNATGTVLSEERRQRLASLSAESGLVIIEDDTGAELVHDGPVPAPVAAFDPEAPVILVKSYAKTVLPGLRLGVILPPPHLDRRVLAAKLVADRYTSPPLVRALAGYLARPEAAQHLERTRLLYRDRRDAFLRSLERRLGGRATWLPPRAGLQPVAAAARPGVGGGDLRARRRPRRGRLARAHLRAAGRPDGAPAAVVLDVTPAEADRGVARLALALRDALGGGGRDRSFESV